VDTELAGHNRPEVLEQIRSRFSGITRLTADDIAGAILYAIGQPEHVSVNEILIRPSAQAD
jgi:NADP-dependent 3-hydroxy acid dehydrogenase YdfG